MEDEQMSNVQQRHLVFDCTNCGDQVSVRAESTMNVCDACGAVASDGSVVVYNAAEYDSAEAAEAADAPDDEECPCCDGTGMAWKMDQLEGDPDEGQVIPCTYCNETGRVPKRGAA